MLVVYLRVSVSDGIKFVIVDQATVTLPERIWNHPREVITRQDRSAHTRKNGLRTERLYFMGQNNEVSNSVVACKAGMPQDCTSRV